MTARTAWLMLVAGLLCFGSTYAYRPPAGLGEAFGMLMQGRDFFIKPPFYQLLLAVSSGLVIIGGASLIRSRPNPQ